MDQRTHASYSQFHMYHDRHLLAFSIYTPRHIYVHAWHWHCARYKPVQMVASFFACTYTYLLAC
jgi:hypothetical protein